MSRWPWPKIAVALAVLFTLATGAGYAVGAQVNTVPGDVAEPATTTTVTTSTTKARPTTTPAPPVTETTTSEPPTTLPPTTTTVVTTVPPTAPPTTVATTVTTADPGPRRPTRDDPLRVVMAGDSVMAGLTPPVKAALEADGTSVVKFILTPSILRDPTVRFTWNQQLAEFNPEVIVMFVGTWESGATAGTGGLSVDAPGWKAAYEQNVLDPWVQLITSRGAHVLWLGNPIVNGDAANHLFPILNSAFRDLPNRWPSSVSYMETNPALNGTESGYHDIISLNGSLIRTRQTDGLHLCSGGAALLGRLVDQFIVDGFKATMGPGWESGTWRNDKLYPASACPAP